MNLLVISDMDKEFALQYQQEEWYKLSRRIKARDHNTCQMCGCNDKPLNVHHLCYHNGNILDAADSELITLCEDCHKEQEVCKNEIKDILQSIRTVLTDFELKCMLHYLFDNIVNDGPFEYRGSTHGLEPTKRFIDEQYEGDERLIKLLNWRRRVRVQENKEEAIKMFASETNPIGSEYLKELKKWFKETYNEDIEDYI